MVAAGGTYTSLGILQGKKMMLAERLPSIHLPLYEKLHKEKKLIV
jgi:hypothetical protein